MKGELIHTVCPYLWCGCSAYVEVVGNRLDLEYTIDIESKGRPCPKGNTILEHLSNSERLKGPLKAIKEGKVKEISWNKAVNEVAERLKEIAKDDPSQLMSFGSARTFNKPNYLLQNRPAGFKYFLKAKEREAKIITADPRLTKTAWFAGIYLQHYPGTEDAKDAAKQRFWDWR